jgi:hypothetical protein
MPRTYFPDLPKLPNPAEPFERLAKTVDAFTDGIVGFEDARRKLFRKVDESIQEIHRAVRQRR